ncbi:MAG: hypothetical protein Q9187_001505 [Circinaria calcarea]
MNLLPEDPAFTFLPRLVPAPQALIRTSRPERLEPSSGKVVGSHSGNVKQQINHVAHILHNDKSLSEFSVRCVQVKKNLDMPPVKASSKGPLTWLSILGFLLSIALVILSVKEQDPFALIATVLLSFLSTIIGIGSKWSLELPKRRATRPVPESDVIICYPHGAFLIVKCEEAIARELYWAREKCNYMVGVEVYRFISLVGTLMLMFGVIALANAKLTLQIAFAAAYIILNAAYWVVAALPQRLHWDLSSYETQEEDFVKLDGGNENFTAALWEAIAITRSVDWVKNADIAPLSKEWKEWLNKAEEMAGLPRGKKDPETNATTLPYWDCQAALTEFLKPDNAAKNV